jgi:hypothetical protein
MTPSCGLTLSLALGTGAAAPACAQAQRGWQAPCTTGLAAGQHKFGPWQPNQLPREMGAMPPQWTARP